MDIERIPLDRLKSEQLVKMFASEGWGTLMELLAAIEAEKGVEHLTIKLKHEQIANGQLLREAEEKLRQARVAHDSRELLSGLANQQESGFYTVKIT